MKRICALLMIAGLPLLGFTQTNNYWQQELHYNIQVALNEKQHSLKGGLSVEYINHSPDTLKFIWFHLWPNAYKNKNTAMGKQMAILKANEKQGNPLEKKKEVEHEPGYIDGLKFEVNKQTAATENDTANIDMIKVLLPQPLLPGKQVTVTTPFNVKLPDYYSRSGYSGQQFFVCQWYPKPAVYDTKGWHPIPYLDQGEFFSEYGSFKVDITVPAEYVIGATGSLQNKDELAKYKQIGIENNKDTKLVLYKTSTPGKTKTLQYTGERMLDFAWFAAKDFVVRYDTLQLTPDNTIDVFSYGQPNGNKTWKNSTSYIKDAVRHYSKWIGQYPYPVVQAVEGPKNQSSGGMEYPTITLITSPNAKEEEMDGVITHEVGHNWFMGILGTNERQYAWMDEGINTYYQFRYEAEKYRSNSILSSYIPKDIKELSEDEFQARIYEVLNSIPAEQPINTPSAAFTSNEDYGIVEYVKTAVWMYTLEAALGRDTLDKGMQAYFKDWQFKHPQPEDLKKELETTSGKNLDKLFDLLNKEGKLF
ncbi:peptidase [Niastella koreensis]|uniref:Peptidase n=2 Tax=Niastella koreensis TaxID=354356 RepID=A0ABX3NR53_9BACT|nr:M1 family metallopeptidase [Niastella koreensis]AEW00987.1 putative Zn-dependent aminopeptidase [Niastella koreensis GR20-10]OQP42594.1 peptidase [Niastella koreensis]